MESSSEIIITIIFVGAVTLLFSWWQRTKMKQEWRGQLVDKKVHTSEDDQGFDQTSYSLIFRTDDGKKKSIKVQKALYDMWKVDDRAEKLAGEWWPKRV
jgi:hypothetical protein